MAVVPDWLKEGSLGPCACCAVTVSRRRNYLSRGLAALGGFFAVGAELERSQKIDGFMQRRDPRVKVAGLLLFLTAAGLGRDIRLLMAMYASVVALAVASRLRMARFIGRPMATVLLFSMLGVFPAMLDVFVPGPRLLTLYDIGHAVALGPVSLPASLGVSAPGMQTVLLVFARALTMSTAVWVLVVTTRFDKIAQALLWLRVPAVFVALLQLTRIYSIRLAGRAVDLHQAKRSRTVRLGGAAKERQWVSWGIGFLLDHALRAGDELGMAMKARGFNGEARFANLPVVAAGEWAMLAVFAGGLAALSVGLA